MLFEVDPLIWNDIIISVVGPPKTALYARQTTTADQKNVKIENAVETMTPTSWMPLR